MEKDELTFKQEKAAFYIVSGMNLKDVAGLVGCNESTLFRWLRSAAMQNRVRELKRVITEHSLGKLQRLNDKAIDTLESLLDCTSSPASRCRAASIILTKNHESIDFFEYSERLRLIEQRFSNENK
jgi:transposase-like protein